jgi:mono/diheme cytochrome c family protein
MKTRYTITAAALAIVLGVSLSTSAQHKPHTHRHPTAAKLTNPVAASPESVASGRTLYDRECADCHGASGKGDGRKGEGLTEKPSDLTDAQWEHGTSDGEMFVVIRDGAGPKSEMKGFAKKLTTRHMWDVVNFVRSLKPQKSHQ